MAMGAVPTRTPTLKSRSARGTKYIVYEAYLVSIISHIFIMVSS